MRCLQLRILWLQNQKKRLYALKEGVFRQWVLIINQTSTRILSIFFLRLFHSKIQFQGQQQKVVRPMTISKILINLGFAQHLFAHTFMTYLYAFYGLSDGFFIICSAVFFATKSVTCSLYHLICSRNILKRENNLMITRRWMPWFIFWKRRQDL